MPWLNIIQAAETLEISKRSVWRRIEDGTLQSRKEDSARLVYVETTDKDTPHKENDKKTVALKKADSISLSALPSTPENALLILDIIEHGHILDQCINSRVELFKLSMKIFFDEDDSKYKYRFWVNILQHIKVILAEIVNKDELTELKLRKIFHALLKDRTFAGNFEQAHINKNYSGEYAFDISEKKEAETARKMLISAYDEVINDMKKLIASFG